MSESKNEEQNLETFEARLAALRPRSDRLDADVLAVLVKEAALTAVQATSAGRCMSPTGHRFACIHCGYETPRLPAARGWAWPAAFWAMTTVAAMLLILLVPPTPQIAVRNVETTATVAHTRNWELERRPPVLPDSGGLSCFALRDLVLREGIDAWKSPVATVATTPGIRMNDHPMSRREQLEQLLNEQGFRGT